MELIFQKTTSIDSRPRAHICVDGLFGEEANKKQSNSNDHLRKNMLEIAGL